MLRFPNPGSNIDSFIKIYKELFDALSSAPHFTLDDITKTLVERNLATSSGYMGQEALVRSTRDDRSLDPLYNQSKMYAELFRMLGWFHSLPDSNLKYRMTYLGAHVVSAYNDVKPLIRESILGIAFPNEILESKGHHILRPFASILLSMKNLDNVICRDEIIIGPLSLSNDRQFKNFSQMIEGIKNIRGSYTKLERTLNIVSQQSKIALNTMSNYTRFPLAVLVWCGWTQKNRNKNIYNKSIVFHTLTEIGQELAKEIELSVDLRADDFQKFDNTQKIKLARFCFFIMLGRAGFDLAPVQKEIAETAVSVLPVIFKKTKVKQFLFSPFQEFSFEKIEEIFPEIKVSSIEQPVTTKEKPVALSSPFKSNSNLFAAILLERASSKTIIPKRDHVLVDRLKQIYHQHGEDINKSIIYYMSELQNFNKNDFYPFIASLFRVLGYGCEDSRVGVNYQRCDAMIIDQNESIPIEIKSPGEEQNISVKAVRQALENKIILLSRKSYATKHETTSLVVGFYMPNDRSEVAALLEDIKTTFKIKIGIIDCASLLKLCYEAIINNQYPKDIANLYGFIKI